MAAGASPIKCRLRMDSITRGDFKPDGRFSSFQNRHEAGPASLIRNETERPSAGFVSPDPEFPKEMTHVP